jgi:hypothetical protein
MAEVFDEENNVKEGQEDEEQQSIEAVSLKQILKLQSLARRWKARKQCLLKLETRYEKIYDPKRKKFFYYDIIKDLSSWKKPKLFKENDLTKISALYTKDEAANLIQKQFRRFNALRRVRMLFQKRIKIQNNRRTKITTFYNKVTKVSFSKLPNFMSGKLNYEYEIGRESQQTKGKLKKKKKNESESEESEEEGDEDFDEEEDKNSDAASSASDSSSVIQAKRRAARIHPRSPLCLSVCLSLSLSLTLSLSLSLDSPVRSKAQSLIDACEDRTDKKASLELNLSGLGATRFSSRIYDLGHLRRLVLSNNQLKRISREIKYLMR